MDTVKQDHEMAMEFADQADVAKRTDDVQQAALLYRQAFDYERRAASGIALDLSAEPTRYVLHRSAASLALDCGEFLEAERLICTALAGNPPDEIADELRDLLQTIYTQREQKSAQSISKTSAVETSKTLNRTQINPVVPAGESAG